MSSESSSENLTDFFRQSLCDEIVARIRQCHQLEENGGQKPYRRGYYTGAFDMFHFGHLRGLQQAMEHCDQLVVAVSTDEVIRDYKHKDPIIPFYQRLAIVSSIKGVSIAIPQYDLYDKLGPAEQLGCDVIFSSDEYVRATYEGKQMSAKQQAGVERWERFEQDARSAGIDVVYLPRTMGISSTEIKERVFEQNAEQQEAKEEVQPTAEINATQTEGTQEYNITGDFGYIEDIAIDETNGSETPITGSDFTIPQEVQKSVPTNSQTPQIPVGVEINQ